MLTATVQTSAAYSESGSAFFSQLPRRGGRGRGEQQIVFGKGGGKIALDQYARLLRLFVVGVVIAGTEHERAQHDAPLDFGAKGPVRVCVIMSDQFAASFGAVSVANAVIARQIAAGLCTGQQVISGQTVWRRAAANSAPPWRPAVRMSALPLPRAGAQDR